MTTNGRLADLQGEIFETPATNGCFTQEQTLAKTGAMTEMRTKPPFLIEFHPSRVGSIISLNKTLALPLFDRRLTPWVKKNS